MTPERWQQVNELFTAVIELEPAKRVAFLDQACAEDPILRREVESLISYDVNGYNLIEQAALE
ncbi:MAG TPA: hypothetical protein VJ372_17030, partial [Pyrinomonadaceae bacterium]|nr:hypothetical protein [Pyrinomonadaceae bacterium]